MTKKRLRTSDIIAFLSLVITTLVTVGMGLWALRLEERLAHLEYDEFAPNIILRRHTSLEPGRYNLSFALDNQGRKAAEGVRLTIISTPDFPLDGCVLGVPFDNIEARHVEKPSVDYIVFHVDAIPPQSRLSGACWSKTANVDTFVSKYHTSPDLIPDRKCAARGTSDLSSSVPSLEVMGTNVEQRRIEYCSTEAWN